MLKNLFKKNRTFLPIKHFFVLVIILLFSLVIIFPVHADTNTDKLNQLETANAAATAKLNQLKAQKNSLTNEIAIFDAQVAVLRTQIAQADAKLSDLNISIIKAELNLKKQQDLMKEYLKTMYIDGQVSTAELIVKSRSFSEFVNQSEYMGTMQENVQDTANKINDLRTSLETEKKRAEVLKAEAENRKVQITAQLAAKNQLLQTTQGNESKYQQIISNNNAQIGVLRCIISGGCNGDAGGNLVAINTHLYYNQKSDPWGSQTYDGTNTFADSGCLITSLAMAHGVDPITESKRHSYNNGEMNIGGQWGDWGSLSSLINTNLASGKPIIVGLRMSGGYTHFVLIKSKSGDKYYINDPYFPAGQSYNTSRVYEAIVP